MPVACGQSFGWRDSAGGAWRKSSRHPWSQPGALMGGMGLSAAANCSSYLICY